MFRGNALQHTTYSAQNRYGEVNLIQVVLLSEAKGHWERVFVKAPLTHFGIRRSSKKGLWALILLPAHQSTLPAPAFFNQHWFGLSDAGQHVLALMKLTYVEKCLAPVRPVERREERRIQINTALTRWGDALRGAAGKHVGLRWNGELQVCTDKANRIHFRLIFICDFHHSSDIDMVWHVSVCLSVCWALRTKCLSVVFST